MSIKSCQKCFEKQCENDKLREIIVSLKSQIRTLKNSQKEGPFGSSTPSSRQHFKPNANEDESKKVGGARKGHQGHGRKTLSHGEVRQETLDIDPHCPDCGSVLNMKKPVSRTIVDVPLLNPETIEYQCSKGWCSRCRKTIQAKPKVLPRSLFGNGLIAQAISLHYEQGIPVGRIEDIYGINHGSLFSVFDRMAHWLKPVVALLILQIRDESVIHADETGWRTNGRSGYAWLFCSARTSIFKFANTRSATIPHEVLGNKRLKACLVRDRYAAYNRINCQQQYCYAHLLRDVEDLEKEFEGNAEIADFVNKMATLLSDAMKLRGRDISDKLYYQTARQIKKEILFLAHKPAQHLGIRSLQDIFVEKQDRLFQWVKDRNIPPDNNKAEREIRPTVIARKVSFGSQSDKGAETKSIIMSMIHTAKKRTKQRTTVDWIRGLLDWWVDNPKAKPEDIIKKLE